MTRVFRALKLRVRTNGGGPKLPTFRFPRAGGGAGPLPSCRKQRIPEGPRRPRAARSFWGSNDSGLVKETFRSPVGVAHGNHHPGNLRRDEPRRPPRPSPNCSTASPTPCSDWPPAPRRWACTRSWCACTRSEGLDFSQVTTFNLDEYVGLTKDHPQSYHYFMHENLFKHINIARAERLHPLGHDRQLRGVLRLVRAADQGVRRDRPAAAGHRLRRPHRLQRALQLARLAHADQDPGRADDRGQRPVLRADRGRADLRDHDGRGDDPRGPVDLFLANGEQGRRRWPRRSKAR